MDDQRVSSPWGRFVLWFFQNVGMPLLPLFISGLVDLLIHVKTHILNGEAILLYSILLPVLYLESSKSAAQRYLFWGISAVGIVLYTAAQLITDLPAASHSVGTATIYHVAAVLDAVYILTASIYELVNTFSANRQVA